MVEVIISITLLGVISGSMTMVLSTASRSFDQDISKTAISSHARRTLDLVRKRVEMSSASRVGAVPSEPFHVETLTFAPVVGYDGADTIWGGEQEIRIEYAPGETNDGTDEDGDGLVDECRIVWYENRGQPGERSAVMANHVAEYADGETFNGLDDNGNGLIDERGLAFDLDGNRMRISLCLEKVGPEGQPLIYSAQRIIKLRN